MVRAQLKWSFKLATLPEKGYPKQMFNGCGFRSNFSTAAGTPFLKILAMPLIHVLV